MSTQRNAIMAGKGVDVEALSPRDANARRPRAPAADPKTELKSKAVAQLKANKDKEHPPPPPAYVTEPPSGDRREGAVYQVGKLLGKGGFAVCYSGTLAGSKQVFALKIVKSRMPAKMEQKFQTELQIHSKMHHPNIVQFLRAFSFEQSTYLVLELCPNGSLMDMVKRRRGVTEPEVRYYAVQIAGAIKYMHARGIIHRDLKMGNIFLDRNMNARIGDFGLAALVVTGRDMQTIRRTTLCGTPNYIAPEILQKGQKGQKGHDHTVDLWSLGIIMFAMLTSKPPFQSSTTDEIYRRAKERDYEWPERRPGDDNASGAPRPPISDDAKHVVASLLQEAHLRPDPDEVVEHPFFTSGYMPTAADITVRLRDLPPDRDVFYRQPLPSRLQARNRDTVREMCAACGLGSDPAATAVVHPKLTKPVWREMAAEEQAGLTPVIPLAEDIVYRPFATWLQENRLRESRQRVEAASTGSSSSSSSTRVDEGPSLAASAPTQPPMVEWLPPVATSSSSEAPATASAPTTRSASGMRAPPQSFAAQQRQQGRAASKRDIPLASGLSLQAREQAAAASKPASSRTHRTALPSRPARTVTPRMTPDVATATTTTTAAAPTTTTSTTPYEGPRLSLFSPDEVPELVPGSEPDAVLARLCRLQAELDRALNARTMALISARERAAGPAPPPQIVVKWVDYTNKFGLGYILNDGSVGCILRAIRPTDQTSSHELLPPSCLVVRGAERHIQRREDTQYADRQQIVPMGRIEGDGIVRFYENHGENGLRRVCVDASHFRVAVDPRTGAAGKLSAGRDAFDHRKRERIVLWKKFANYMLQYGRELEEPKPSDKSASASSSSHDAVTFYQRFGDVGCWVFGDGHLQFNFPDHTKIVLDAAGVSCHFWHLPAAAAQRLGQTGLVDEAALDGRSVLSYPLQTLLNFSTGDASASSSTSRRRPFIRPELQGIPAANDFRHKVEFIRAVVREWVTRGGLGNSDMTPNGRLRWTGTRELAKLAPGTTTPVVVPPSKHVWVTIGARQGDTRVSAMVDPQHPDEVGADLEDQRK